MAQVNGVSSTKSTPTVVGINFGNTYASIAVLTKDGLPDCIANEDGERQIACAVSFHGEEVYIGNQAKPQLVKNAENTIINFRNLLGKKYSDIPHDKPTTSAPVIQHPELPDVPAYKVSILQPAPAPLPTPATRSSATTPAASQLATPRSEPIPAERILTVSEVTTMFLKSLVQSAQDFLGRTVDGAVITVPSWFDDNARSALEGAASDAGVKVLQLLDEAGAASLISVTTPSEGLQEDRTALYVDLGQSALSLSVLSIRHGLIHSVASAYHPEISGELIDEKIVKFFAKEFTKKTKTALQVCPSTEKQDKRAEAKLRLAIEHTKRTISASPGPANCSVESLKDGLDFTGTINRLRFDMEVRTVYESVVKAAIDVLKAAGLEPLHVDEIIYAGGSSSLPGLDETFFVHGFPESLVTPFSQGTVVSGGPSDPTTILARGCAAQAKLLAEISSEDAQLLEAFSRGSSHASVHATSKSIGLIFPGDVSERTKETEQLNGQWVLGVPRETPLPYRRIVEFDCDLGESDEKKVGFELWQVDETVKVEKEKPARLADDEDEEAEEEEEEVEVREKLITKDVLLGSASFVAQHAESVKGRWKTRLQVQFVVSPIGGIILTASEVSKGAKGAPTTLTVPPVH